MRHLVAHRPAPGDDPDPTLRRLQPGYRRPPGATFWARTSRRCLRVRLAAYAATPSRDRPVIQGVTVASCHIRVPLKREAVTSRWLRAIWARLPPLPGALAAGYIKLRFPDGGQARENTRKKARSGSTGLKHLRSRIYYIFDSYSLSPGYLQVSYRSENHCPGRPRPGLGVMSGSCFLSAEVGLAIRWQAGPLPPRRWYIGDH
jgi:hypothetical protein